MAIWDWEEGLFRGARNLVRRVADGSRGAARRAARVQLEETRQPLFLLAQMLAGRRVDLFATTQTALCVAERILLPPALDLAPSRELNRELYRIKTALAALALRNRVDAPDHRTLLRRLAPEFDRLPGLALRLDCLTTQIGEPALARYLGLPQGSVPESSDGLATAADGDCAARDATEITEIEGDGQLDVQIHDGGGDQPAAADMPLHTFEKVETIEEYQGLDRKTDASDELEEHAEALQEIDMRHVVRSRERPRSIYRSDLVLDGLSLDIADGGDAAGIPYPEWDFRARRRREAWCRVQERMATKTDPVWLDGARQRNHLLVDDLKRRFAALANRWMARRREPFGPELDIDAVVVAEVERRGGHTPSERLYVDRRRALHDVAALILMDQSFSTDAWIDGVRVLDTIRDTILCVGEVLDEFVERFAVAGFSSNTRRQCRFDRIKGFGEGWAESRARLGAVVADGYTRIGPALRHAHERLAREAADRKVVILITDGRPCDYDRYEGRYGECDVKHAIETGHQRGIVTHAFAIDRQAREHFPRMFSRRHFHIQRRPQALLENLCALFARLETS